MADIERRLPAEAKQQFAKANTPECKKIADSGAIDGKDYFLPVSKIIEALESIQDQGLRDECAKVIDTQKDAAGLIAVLKAELGSTTPPAPAPSAGTTTIGVPKFKKDENDPLKVHLQLADGSFETKDMNSSVQELLAAYQYNYGLLIAKERTHYIKHIDDQVPAMSFDVQWQGMKLHNPIVRTNQYEHIGRQVLAVGNAGGLSSFTGISNESSGNNILNYSHEDGMKILKDIADQYDKVGQDHIIINGQKIGEKLTDVQRQQIIKQMLIDANEAVKSEADTNLMISTALGIPVAYLMLLGTLRSIEKVGGIAGKVPLIGAPIRLTGSAAGWSANHLKAQGDAFMTWAKSSGLTWEKARDIAKARLSRAKAAVENPTVNEELKKVQVEDIKDPIRDLLWSQYEADLQRARPGYTSDDFAKDIKDGNALPAKSPYIREEMKALSDNVSKSLPIDPSSDPLDRELRIREIEKVLPSNFLDKFYRKVFEGRNPLAFLSNNRWWSMSEKFELGSESTAAKSAREEFTRALSKIEAELGVGIDGEKIKMRLPKGSVDAAMGVKAHIDANAFVSAVAGEGINENKIQRATKILDHDSLSDLTTQTPEEIKKLQKIYGLALANNARTNYDDLKDKFADSKQALEDATADKDKYTDAEKDFKDQKTKRDDLGKAKNTFVGDKLESAKSALRNMYGTLSSHTHVNGNSIRTTLLSNISDALSSGDKTTIEAKAIAIRGLVTQYDVAQSSDDKKVGSFVDTAENAVREMGQVNAHASLAETRQAVTDAEARFNAHALPQGENTDFRTENRRLERAHKDAERAYEQAKRKFEAIPEEVRDLLEQKTNDELKDEKARVDRVVRAHETKARSEAERTKLRENVEKTGARVGVDPDSFKRGTKSSIPDAGRSQLASFQEFTSDPANDFHRIVTDARARGYEIRQEGKKVTIVDTSKPGEAPKTYDTTVKTQELAMYEHLTKLKVVTARIRP